MTPAPESLTLPHALSGEDITQGGAPAPWPPQEVHSTLEPGAAFGSRYHILRVLGAGGMGIVYHAWDGELGVAVALKVIRPEVMADPSAARDVERRFKRELLLARQVTHKNVVRIHDLGEVDGIKYITMPFIEGTSLAATLASKGKLTVAQTLPIARDVAAGLLAAHQAGVVHRDLKPENVMLESDGTAVIMDFGISRREIDPITDNPTRPAHGTAGFDASALAAGLTVAGTVVGTLEYMAPEQARAEPADHRADIYSFGLIVRDLLLGSRKRTDSNAIADLMARAKEAPPPLRSIAPDVPEAVEAIVTRCLQPAPGDRYQATQELLDDLRRLDDAGLPLPEPRKFTRRHAIAAAVLLLALLTGTWWVAQPPPPVVQPPPTSVLIADFQNKTGDPVFDGALEETLASAMEGASFITAYPRADAARLARTLKVGTTLDPAATVLIARREGIKVILAGTVEPAGTGYRVGVSALDPVVDPPESKPLASLSASAASKGDVLRTLASVAAELRAVLGDTTPESARMAAAETFTAASLDAVRAYARGEELNRSGKPQEALQSLEQAVALDAGFGMAYVHIASIYTNLKIEDKAKEYYEEAFKHLDRMTEREKLRSRGVYYFGVVRNYKEAIKAYEELVEKYPADNTGLANLALAHVYDRNIPKAVEMGRKAIEIYPRNILQRTNYATYAMYGGDFKTAITEARRVLEENPAYEWANLTLALSLLAAGDEPGARQAYEQLSQVSPLGASLANMGLADLEMYSGHYARALKILEEGVARDERDKNSNNLALKLVAAAEAHFAIGNRRAATAAAERASRLSDHEAVVLPAAQLLIQLGKPERAREVVHELETKIPPHIRSYARIISADLALYDRRVPQAIDDLHAAEKLHDSWLVHELLAKAYQAAEDYPQAAAEWDRCIARRGEAADVFLADTSSLRYLPPSFYWLGRAQQSLGSTPAAAENYRKYVAIRGGADVDRLAADAAARLKKF